MKFLLLIPALAFMAWVKWRFSSPADPIGTVVRGFDSSYRQNLMIRVERDQRHNLRFPLA